MQCGPDKSQIAGGWAVDFDSGPSTSLNLT